MSSFDGQIEFLRRLFEGLDEIKYVSGATAGNSGDRVHFILITYPYRFADSIADTFDCCDLVLAQDAFRRETVINETCDAFADKRRGVRHRAHQRALRTQPACKIC